MKTKTKKAEIEFDANELLRRMKGFAAGREPARERTVKLPPPVKTIPAKQIRAIRLGLSRTQTEFATPLNVPTVTAISWENGTRKPSGAALRLCWPWPGITRRHSMRSEIRSAREPRSRSLPANPTATRC